MRECRGSIPLNGVPSWEIIQTLHLEGEQQFPSTEKNLMDSDFMNKLEGDSSNVKNRPTRSSPFWEGMGANNFIFRILKEGNALPFVEEPQPSEFKNHGSTSKYSKFVFDVVKELEAMGHIREVTKEKVHTVCPLEVVDNDSKRHLILDLRHYLDQFLSVPKFK